MNIPLDDHGSSVLAASAHRVPELPHPVHLPLSLQLTGCLRLNHSLIHAEFTEDVGPEASLDLDCRIVHTLIQLSLLNQRVQVENVHVHHHIDWDVTSQVLVALVDFVDDVTTDRYLIRQPAILLKIIVKPHEAHLPLHPIPGGRIQPEVSPLFPNLAVGR